MRRLVRHKKTLAVLLVLVAVGAGWFWRSADSTAPRYREAKVERGDVEVAVVSTGVVQPRNRLEIKPPVAGRMDQIDVREGENVKRGQLMAWMSSNERAALLDAARAKGADELKRWEELYRPTPIYAPLTGTVIVRKVEPGQTVTAQEAILVMSDRLVLKAQVDETDIAQVRKGAKAKITLDAYPDQALTGVVDQIAYEAKNVNNVITYDVYVLPERVPEVMRSGMTANVSFRISTKTGALLVPTEAIRMHGRQPQVLLAADDAREEPQAQPVELGLSDGRRTEIVSGLDEGATVLMPLAARAEKGAARSNPLAPSRNRR